MPLDRDTAKEIFLAAHEARQELSTGDCGCGVCKSRGGKKHFDEPGIIRGQKAIAAVFEGWRKRVLTALENNPPVRKSGVGKSKPWDEARHPRDGHHQKFVDNNTGSGVQGGSNEGRENNSASVGQSAAAKRALEAASYVEQDGLSNPSDDGRSAEIDRQSARLIDWARKNNLILKPSVFDGLEKLPTNTAEHEVYADDANQLAVKQTHPGLFGVNGNIRSWTEAATPAEYLRRMVAANKVFSDDIHFEGVILRESNLIGQRGEKPCIVTTQPWVDAADENNPAPSKAQIGEYMRGKGFAPLQVNEMAWARQSDHVRVYDTRGDNFILAKDGVHPIDLVVVAPKSLLEDGVIGNSGKFDPQDADITKAYDPNQARDEDGKWTNNGDGEVVFHGTTKEALRYILEEGGLSPGNRGGATQYSRLRDETRIKERDAERNDVFVTTSAADAES